MAATPAIQAVERAGIDYALHEYAHDPTSTSFGDEAVEQLGMRKRLPTHVDSSALAHETILVNAGRRGLQLELAPGDLVRLTAAKVQELTSGA